MFKGASTSQVIVARNEMMMDDYDDQMIFGDLVGLKLLDIRLTGEEKPRKNLTQETCPNPGPLRDKRACYHLLNSGGLEDNIKMNLREVVCDPGDRIALAEGRDQWAGLCKGGNEPPGSLKANQLVLWPI